MTNRRETEPLFHKGQRLTAEALNEIVEQRLRHIAVGPDMEIRAAARGVAITTKNRGRRPPADTIVVTLGAIEDGSSGEAVYNWTLYKGSGPDSGVATELNGTLGLPPGLRVILRRAADEWWFEAPLMLRRFQVVSIHDHHLVCTPLVESTAGGAGDADAPDADVTIAKPWDLQRRAWDTLTLDGVTYTYVDEQTRTAAEGAVEETQIVVPPYVAGSSIIYAMRVSNGPGKGFDSDTLMDINVTGRAWAKEFEE